MNHRVKILLNYLVLIGIAGSIIGLDQWTKYLVKTNLTLGETWSPLPDALAFMRIVHWKNTGAAFGLFPQASLIFTGLAILVSLAILYYWPRVPAKQIGLRIALAFQLGGAVGNLVDRLNEGIVTDFIAIGSFPVFNVADSSISIGVAILILATWLDEKTRREQDKGEKVDEKAIVEAHLQEVDTAE